ncbi:MAG: TlpA family protein disulfide reductase [Rhodoferax sp.]|nr:TlpA family protein disulfide reductase [Rhodoferax sp.]
MRDGATLAPPPPSLKRRIWVGVAAAIGLGSLSSLWRWMRESVAENSVLELHSRPRDLANLRFSDSRGSPTDLAAFQGRVVLLNIWATWCPPCREEMPTLDRLQATLGSAGFEVVALSIDRAGMPVVEAFFKRIAVSHLRPYLDTFGDASRLVATGVPLTLLIDIKGRELGRKLGPAVWDAPEMLALIRSHIPASAAHSDARRVEHAA